MSPAIASATMSRSAACRRAGPANGLRPRATTAFGPLGPWLVTTDEIPDPQALDLTLDLNGTRMQTGNTSTMIFTVAKLVSYISKYMSSSPAT